MSNPFIPISKPVDFGVERDVVADLVAQVRAGLAAPQDEVVDEAPARNGSHQQPGAPARVAPKVVLR